MPEELKPRFIPYGAEYLWEWFCELQAARQYGMGGALPFTYTELKAWAELTGKQPMIWEIETLKQLDVVYINETMRKS